MSTDRKVNLFIVGAAKSGTTSLAKLFSLNENFFVPEHKEPFYFLEGWGVNTKEDYKKLYENANNEKYLVDASTSYLYSKETAEKIKKYNPDAKIIIILRNPIDFCFSYWKYMQANGNESSDFIEALNDKSRRIRKSEEFKEKCEQWPGNYQYIDRALFSKQVDYYLEEFGLDSVKIVLFENLVESQYYVKDIFDFLEVNSDDYNLPRENSGGVKVGFYHSLRFSPKLRLIKSPFKSLIPINMRIKIRNYLRGKSFDRSKGVQVEFNRAEVAEKFNKDVVNLKKKLSNLDFSSWKDFENGDR